MNALIEEAVFHESEGILKVGLVHGEEGILWGKPRLVAKVEPKCDLGCGSARALFHLSLFIMPKIRTTRTKKAPDGFEEIEPVRILYFFHVTLADPPLARFLTTMGERCAMPRMNPMKASASPNPYGL